MRGYTLSVARADAGRRFCDVAAGSASQAVTVTFTGIAGLASAGSAEAGEVYRDAFTVWGSAGSVAGAGCSLTAGPPSQSAERSYTLSVARAVAGSRVCVVAGGGATVRVTVAFTASPVGDSISGLASAGTILAGATYIDAFTVTGASASVSGEGCSLLHTSTSSSGVRGYTLSVARADAGRRFCDVAAGSASQAVTVTFTGIAGLASAGSAEAGEVYRDAFTVWGSAGSVAGAGCSLSGGPPSLSAERSYTLSVARAVAGTSVCVVAGGGATVRVTVAFTAPPVGDSISGLASAGTILAGRTYIDAFTVTGAPVSVSGEGCSLLGPFDSGVYALVVRRTDAGRRFCDVAAGSVSQAVTVTFTGIAGLASAGSAEAGEVYRDAFTVWGSAGSVAGAGCSLTSGPPSQSAERGYTLNVTRSDAGTRVCTVTGGGATQAVTVAFTPVRPVITGLTGVSRVSTSLFTAFSAPFSVQPADAICSSERIWEESTNPAAVYLRNNSGRDRILRAVFRTGEVTVDVRCVASGLAVTERVVFTVLSPDACELPITPGAAAVTRTWTTSCTSTQRGDNQTPYHAKKYTFTLAEAATVTVVATSDQATSVYVLSDPHPEGTAPHASGTTQASAPLAAGDYQIEVARSKPRLADGSFTLAVSTDATACGDEEVRLYDGSCSPAGQTVYAFTKSTVVLTREVAIRALEMREMSTCTSLTVDKLSALMLAIPVRELQRSSPSPMFLGRGDNLRNNPRSEWLYSNKTREDERRAHWHAGVGLWQLDPWPPVRALNHAERADILKGGPGVAAHIRDKYCTHHGEALWEREVFDPWYGCEDKSNPVRENRDLCPPTYRNIYDEAGDSLWVVATEGSEIDGGVQDRLCVWSRQRPAALDQGFGCHLYDPESHEGNMDIDNEDGTDSADNPNGYTPLAVAFISLTNPDETTNEPDETTNEGTKYAVFPKANTGYAHTLIKAVPKNKYSRSSRLGPDGNGWYAGVVDGKYLYVREGTNEQCGASDAATAAICEWTRM